MEEWRDIQGYEGLYQVSNKGTVKSLGRKVKRNDQLLTIPERVLSLADARGYKYAQLWKDNKRKRWAVHRLVAIAFIPNPDNKPEVDHLDTNPSNNCVDNLAWVTSFENSHNPITEHHIKNMPRPSRGKEYADKVGKRFSKAVSQYSMQGKLNRVFSSAAEAQRITGINSSHICECRRGVRKQAGGFMWKPCGVLEEE